jgi:hypothetical protein
MVDKQLSKPAGFYTPGTAVNGIQPTGAAAGFYIRVGRFFTFLYNLNESTPGKCSF